MVNSVTDCNDVGTRYVAVGERAWPCKAVMRGLKAWPVASDMLASSRSTISRSDRQSAELSHR